MGDHEAGCAFVEDQLVSIDDLSELAQQVLDCAGVGHEVVDDLCPRLVQALVPDTRAPKVDVFPSLLLVTAETMFYADLADCVASLGEDNIAHVGHDQIHLVDQHKDLCLRRVLAEGLDNRGIVDEVGIELARFNIKDEDQDGDGCEDA